jgi:hypothetical protein
MLRKLKKCFIDYMNDAVQELRPAGQHLDQGGVYQLIGNKHFKIRQIVNKLEKGAGFLELAEEFKNTFPDHPFAKTIHPDYEEQEMHDVNYNSHYFMAREFFRRSGFYNQAAANSQRGGEDLFDTFIAAVNRDGQKVSYLLPMVEVYLKEDSIPFDSFKIVKFSTEELSDLLGLEINRTFYPNAVLDAGAISGTFYIVADQTERFEQPLPSPRRKDPDKGYKFQFTKYPNNVEHVLSSVVLYDFLKRHKQPRPIKQLHDTKSPDNSKLSDLEQDILFKKVQERLKDFQDEDKMDDTEDFSSTSLDQFMWLSTFEVPWALKVTDNLLIPPEHCDPSVRSGLGADPYAERMFTFHKKYTHTFIRFVSEKNRLLDRLRREGVKEWFFFDIALGFFLKGFFSPQYEQILWHTVALESLLGEKDNITRSVARRVGLLLGRDEAEQMEIEKNFKKLYDFRCRIVHGGDFKMRVKLEFHKTALTFARKSILWFLYFLNFVLDMRETEGKLRLPSRKDILSIIDSGGESKDLMRALAGTVPESFPYVKDWVK